MRMGLSKAGVPRTPSTRRATLTIALALGAAGCGMGMDSSPAAGPPDANVFYGGPEVDIVQPGVINFLGDRDFLFAIPPRLTTHAPFTLEVRTFGGGCTRTAEYMSVEWKGKELVLTPHDRTYKEDGASCTVDLFRLLHSTELTLPEPGSFNVRLRGRARGALGHDTPTSYVFPLVVHPAAAPAPQPGPTSPTGLFPPTH